VPAGRLVGLDIARCLALLGMIATHALPTATAAGEATAVHQLVAGRSSALFAVLAGVSLALMSGRTEPLRGRPLAAAAAGLAVRAVIVALIGLLLGGLGTTIAIILTYYGVLFLLGLPFLGLRAGSLAVLAVAVAVVVPVVSHAVRPLLPDRGYTSPSPLDLAEPGRFAAELLLTGYYPALPWLAYLLAGMALGRLDLGRAHQALTLVLLGAGTALLSLAVSGWLLSRDGVLEVLTATLTGPGARGTVAQSVELGLYGTTPTGSWWWLAVAGPHSATPLDLLHTIGCALVVIGLCLLLAPLAPRTLSVVFGAGTMTLTLYSLHVVLRVPGTLDGDDVPTFLTHVVVVLAVGAAFRLAGLGGPLERMTSAAADGVRRSLAGRPDDTAPGDSTDDGAEAGALSDRWG
jgi:uncharacterized membrane protein